MNTTEHLVEIYYRQLGCFTASDIKVINGNNRQFDLLAFNYKTKKLSHIEVSVAHGEHWAWTIAGIKEEIRYKFFGIVRNSRPENPNTDFAKGKSYLDSIKETYSIFGINYNEVVRVWCTWCLRDQKYHNDWKLELANEFNLCPENFELLLFRDNVLPTLLENVGTANYNDELLRTLSLIKEHNKQVHNLEK